MPESDQVASYATVELSVGGMHCQSCVSLISESLADLAPVRDARVDLESGHATVTYDAGEQAVEEICRTIQALGYTATPVTSSA